MALFALVVSGCSSAPTDGQDEAVGVAHARGPVTVAVAGDVHFEGSSAAALQPDGLRSVTPVLSAADLSIVNLETAVTERGQPAAKQYTFRAPPAALTALRSAGVDVVGMANNHSLDYGTNGLADTLAAGRAAKLPLIGIGQDAEQAFQPHVVDIRGHRVAVLAATQVLDSSLAQQWTAAKGHPGVAAVQDVTGQKLLLLAVKTAAEQADSVIVLMHWGQERNPCPLPRQESLAEDLISAGADAVVGSHAHVQLGNGWLTTGGREGFVDYGLGNFVFYARGGAAAQSGVLTLTLPATGGVSSAAWQPARIQGGVPQPLSGVDSDKAIADKEALRECTDLAPRP
ncbi:poly-gamma-glutamate synthesis protein (capsule biosynthesis protein) [Kineococcus radiotolerans]|uniref:Poly-gamma-glutamate synthesis protein (Capsule biosynthesis protein) n=1 Tax=Kineococcus radiotolerans TaxID=131568 RepID=A0A7W4XZT3_KINRA|nr:poly-gamma-glutamate synthesis protein (capsule biosynthesis protein) [Kineococcus radiotolerans]